MDFSSQNEIQDLEELEYLIGAYPNLQFVGCHPQYAIEGVPCSRLFLNPNFNIPDQWSIDGNVRNMPNMYVLNENYFLTVMHPNSLDDFQNIVEVMTGMSREGYAPRIIQITEDVNIYSIITEKTDYDLYTFINSALENESFRFRDVKEKIRESVYECLNVIDFLGSRVMNPTPRNAYCIPTNFGYNSLIGKWQILNFTYTHFLEIQENPENPDLYMQYMLDFPTLDFYQFLDSLCMMLNRPYSDRMIRQFKRFLRRTVRHCSQYMYINTEVYIRQRGLADEAAIGQFEYEEGGEGEEEEVEESMDFTVPTL